MKLRSGHNVISLFLVCLMVILSGCSETTKEAPPLPDIVFPVTFPFIENGNLYSIENNRHFGLPVDEPANSNEDSKELLLNNPSGLILALDTDKSDQSTEDGVDTFFNTPLPEYIAYADTHSLKLFDLSTRRNHQLYSFESDPFNAEAQPAFICDIRKVTTWDEDARLSRQILFKDEMAIYVKTSTSENCDEPSEGFQYWQINVEESTETFTIRRKTLKAHTHEHRHFHQHDLEGELSELHNHPHFLEEGELDENGERFNPNDHTHRHTHSHDFIYEEHHEHEFLSQEEIDAVHNDPVNHTIVFETHPVLIGRRTTITSIDEALMYSGIPVIDTASRNFGYLGFNSKEGALKFFEINLDSQEKRLLWSIKHDNLTGLKSPPDLHQDWRALVPDYNRQQNYLMINDRIGLFSEQQLFQFSIESLFDDDATTQRKNSLDQPLFSSNDASSPLEQRTNFNLSRNKMVISENNQIWLLDLESDLPATLVKQFSETDLLNAEAVIRGGGIMAVKRFNSLDSSSVSIAILEESGIEVQTLISRTSDAIQVQQREDNSFLNMINASTQQLSARLLLSTFGSPLPDLQDTYWLSQALDYRSFLSEIRVSQVSSDNLSIIPGTMELPVVYFLDLNDPLGRGEQIETIDEAVRSASGLVIFNNFYNILEYQNAADELIIKPTIRKF
jgi:hypothetical protein